MNQNNSSEQEIDLSQLAVKIKELINYFLDKFFDFLIFIKNNIKVLILLILLGFISGVLISKVGKSYEQKIIVSPNYNSIDYLYNKIDLINSKLIENDSLFFKSIGISNYRNLGKIDIQPIVDVYGFVETNKKSSNLELIKLFVQEKELTSIITDKVTSKNFPNHLIQFETKGVITKEQIIDPLLNYFNSSNYYLEIKNLALQGINFKIKSNDSVIVQIDKILANYSNVNNKSNSTQLLYISENNQLNDLIKQKIQLAKESDSLKIELFKKNEIIKEISVTTNTIEIEKKNTKYKYILPAVFVLSFILYKILTTFYKKQLKKRNLL